MKKSQQIQLLLAALLLFKAAEYLTKSYESPLYLSDPITYTKKGKIRKQASRRRDTRKIEPRMGPIPQKIQDILVGTLLGDCSGHILAKGVNPTFAFKQSYPEHWLRQAYLFYIYFIFLCWGYANLSIPLPYKSTSNKGDEFYYIRFRTIANKELMPMYLMFYPNGIKIVPLDIAKYLTPRALAFWIMDDGSWAGSGLLLHTNSFTESEVDLLIAALHANFGFNANKRNRYGKWIIYIPAKDVTLLRSIVLYHMHKSFYYKIGN